MRTCGGSWRPKIFHLSNILEMGNISGTHFKQSAWGSAGQLPDATAISSSPARKSENRSTRPHDSLERGAAHARAGSLLSVPLHLRAHARAWRHDWLRAPRRAVQRPARPRARRAVRPDRFHRGAAGRPVEQRDLVPVPESRLQDLSGRRRRLPIIRTDAAWRRADVCEGRWCVHAGIVVRGGSAGTRLRDQRTVHRVQHQRQADGGRTAGGAWHAASNRRRGAAQPRTSMRSIGSSWSCSATSTRRSRRAVRTAFS